MYFALKILLREGLTSGQSILLYRTSLGSWCNGSTTVFGTVCRGSNPCEPATFLAPQCIAELFWVYMIVLHSVCLQRGENL